MEKRYEVTKRRRYEAGIGVRRELKM